MSESSDSGSDDVKQTEVNGKSDDDICRDFLRNVCRRGKRCKYRHPFGAENGVSMGPPTTKTQELTFCHDYQNTGCHRPTCKFLHCTREEEEHYHQTGQLPQRIQHNTQSGGNGGGSGCSSGCGGSSGGGSDIPVCRDYMKGDCKRGAKCKYRHVSSNNNNDFECDIHRSDVHSHARDMRSDHMRQHLSELRSNHGHSFSSYHEDNFHDKFDRFDYGHSQGSDVLKRRRLDMDGFGPYESRYGAGLTPSPVRPISYQYQVLEEENIALRRRVEELKKQVADLTATNEVLLEQNARLRVAKSTVSTMQLPVTVSQSMLPTVTLGLTSMGQPPPSLQGALGSHLSTSLTQQIAMNSDLATQHALQSAAQRMAREMQQQQPVGTGGPQRPQGAPPQGLGGPPSLNQLSLPQTNMVTVSLPSLVSPASLQQVPCGSMSQNMGTASSSLVSYPIMSQDMRCAVVPSSITH